MGHGYPTPARPVTSPFSRSMALFWPRRHRAAPSTSRTSLARVPVELHNLYTACSHSPFPALPLSPKAHSPTNNPSMANRQRQQKTAEGTKNVPCPCPQRISGVVVFLFWVGWAEPVSFLFLKGKVPPPPLLSVIFAPISPRFARLPCWPNPSVLLFVLPGDWKKWDLMSKCA